MRSQTQIIEELLRTWMGEFGRAVEMFNGEHPELSSKRSQLLPADEVNSLLWMKHVFSSKGDFATWIGAKEATWRVLGGSLGGGDPEILRTYSEMLNQAQQGTANVLSTELGKSVYCKQGEFLSAPDFDQAQVAIFSLGMAAGQPPSVFWAVELASADILEPHEADPAPAPKANGEQGAAAVSLMDRLLDLELPVSVALGRANLPIKEVLKITSGSVIELNKEVGEPVDLVVHGAVVARGEIVLVKGNYGVRITQIVSRTDRLSLCRDEK